MAADAKPGSSEAAPLVAPGTLVRWPGDDLSRCGLGERTWAPLDGACWYAIDLLHAEGPLEVSRWTGSGRETAEVRVSEYVYPVQYITLKDDTRVNLSPESLERVASERERIVALWGLDGPARFSLPLSAPLAELPEGGRFGSRRFFNNEPRSPHTGADYAAAEGTPVLAVAPGKIALAADLFFSGESVFIDHGDGLISMYFHLSKREVEEGADVGEGQVVGLVGATGRATGPHLHFGVRWKGARIDPSQLLSIPSAVATLR